MPHDPNTVKLRGGAATPKNVKLFPWMSGGIPLTITETDSGAATDAVYVDRVLLIVDNGAGSEVIQALVPSTITVTDDGAGSEAIFAHATKLYQIKEPSSDLDVYRAPHQEIKRLSSHLDIFHIATREEVLGSGEPTRMISASANDVDVLNTTGKAIIDEVKESTLRTGSSQKIPKGYLQGGRYHHVIIYIRGRNTILDAYLEETGDSRIIEELRINGVDKTGAPANIYIYDAIPYAADALLGENGGVFAYRFVAARIYEKSHGQIIKLTAKPISAPLTIIFTHPEIKIPSSEYEVYLNETIKVAQMESELEVTMST